MKLAVIILIVLSSTTNAYAMERSHVVEVENWMKITVYERMRLMTDIYFQDDFVDSVLISNISLNSLLKSLKKIKAKWEKASGKANKIGGCLESELEEEIGRIRTLTLSGGSSYVKFYFNCSAGVRRIRSFASDEYVVNTVQSNQPIEQLSLLISELEQLKDKIKN